jgi:hypothetical protein
MKRRAWLLLPLAAALGCDDGPVACTEEFRVATVFVRDTNAQAVADATVRTYLDRTGALVPFETVIDLAPGNYVILDDGATRLIRSDAEAFRVTVERGETPPLEARYAFRAPQGCHIEKVSGPDTLVVP